MTLPAGYLVQHLSWAEYFHTDKRKYWAQQMDPAQDKIRNAKRWGTTIFTPVRAIWGPTLVTSGYRCPELNADPDVRGDPQSLHLEALAGDLVPINKNLFDAYVEAAHLPRELLPYDQLIFEYGQWIHVQCTRKTSGTPRRQLLMKWKGHAYESWDPTDPRVQKVARAGRRTIPAHISKLSRGVVLAQHDLHP